MAWAISSNRKRWCRSAPIIAPWVEVIAARMVLRLPIPVRTGTTLDTVLKVLRSNAVVRAATGRLRLTSSCPEIRAR